MWPLNFDSKRSIRLSKLRMDYVPEIPRFAIAPPQAAPKMTASDNAAPQFARRQ